ncbi:MarR family winged helix-turn-helix transcriptional regulator [Paeniglutamicibacter psychrophenolicus]|uniref:DNA-binding MarR family transcriptional regulator n=1 Tax=Paeniglutamicibacter psychrophenolicus TaxID=257454 RepID=A0ABS4WJN6_9MICC|nr:MarR family winged helix-turn-helix transcriptional regulator [Paeniglutamicibacter psychrophenolicus]MBP2376415.1 DNA-binding MarR family transcriptional regulator [Paeniglutamicibacter psychrophenolicus]
MDTNVETATLQQDAVDGIVKDWMRILPGTDVSSLQIMSRMLRVIRSFERRREDLLIQYGLEPWSFDMLAALRRNPGGVSSPGELIAATLVTSGTMTTRLKSLERRGLIVRRKGETDGRNVVVTLTAAGRESVDDAFEDVLQVQRDVVASLNDHEQAALEGVLRTILSAQEPPTITN